MPVDWFRPSRASSSQTYRVFSNFQGGIYFFQLIDYFAAALSLMYLAFFEVIAITWIYGKITWLAKYFSGITLTHD